LVYLESITVDLGSDGCRPPRSGRCTVGGPVKIADRRTLPKASVFLFSAAKCQAEGALDQKEGLIILRRSPWIETDAPECPGPVRVRFISRDAGQRVLFTFARYFWLVADSMRSNLQSSPMVCGYGLFQPAQTAGKVPAEQLAAFAGGRTSENKLHLTGQSGSDLTLWSARLAPMNRRSGVRTARIKNFRADSVPQAVVIIVFAWAEKTTRDPNEQPRGLRICR
jgi:hypothetical protein